MSTIESCSNPVFTDVLSIPPIVLLYCSHPIVPDLKYLFSGHPASMDTCFLRSDLNRPRSLSLANQMPCGAAAVDFDDSESDFNSDLSDTSSESGSSCGSESDSNSTSDATQRRISNVGGAALNDVTESDEDDASVADEAELRLQRAIELILNSPRSSKSKTGHVMSIRAAAAKVGCPKSTLALRWNGGQPRALAHGGQQKVAPAMELAMVEWIVELGRRGIPATRSLVMEKAESITGTELGERWYDRFKKRHAGSLAARWTRSLETARAQGLNKTAVSAYFKERERLLKAYNIRPENDYNLDEKGILNGQGDKARVLVHRQQQNVYQIHSGGRELSTVIECFAASGKALRPTLIHKGQRLRSSWFSDNPGKFRCGVVTASHAPVKNVNLIMG